MLWRQFALQNRELRTYQCIDVLFLEVNAAKVKSVSPPFTASHVVHVVDIIKLVRMCNTTHVTRKMTSNMARLSPASHCSSIP